MRKFYFSFKFVHFPFLMSIFYFAQLLFGIKLRIKSKLIIPFINSFSLLLAILLEDISIYFEINYTKTKRITSHELENYSLFSFIQNNTLISKRLTFSKYLLIALLSSFENGFFFYFAYLQTYGLSAVISLLGLILTWIESWVLFRKKFHRHQLFSLIIIAVISSIYYPLDYLNFNHIVTHYFKNYLNFFIFLILFLVSSTMKEVYEHSLMINNFISPLVLLFIEGAGSMIIYIIYVICIQWVPYDSKASDFFSSICNDSQWKLLYNDLMTIFGYQSIAILYGWLYIILSFAMNYMRIQTNKRLSPTHRYMAEMVFALYWFIYDFFNLYIQGRYLVKMIIIRFLNSVFLIISVFIFNGYLIINICELGIDTFTEIDRRSGLESIDVINNINLLNDNNDNDGHVVILQ